jgi:hypothetical protein
MHVAYQQRLHEWLRGHTDAIAFLETVLDAAHVCDDLTDRDATVTTATVQQTFWALLFDLQRNPFYQAHFAMLNSVLQLGFLNWEIANQLEVDRTPEALHVAFILRSSYLDLITMCAFLIGGHTWAVQVGLDARRYATEEGFVAYCEALTKEHRQPHVIEGA